MLTIDRDFFLTLLTDLVQIESTNPDLSPDGSGELAIATHCATVMRDLGLDVSLDVVSPGRANVVGRLAGGGDGRTLMLNAHLDTVSIEGMDAPFSAEIRKVDNQTRLYGRGSQDMKGSMAAQIAAAKAIIDADIKLNGDLLITGVCDEEYASIGMQHLVANYSAEACIVTEPTDMQLCRAHRGFVWYKVHAQGRAAHGSRYDEGIDAIMHMGRFLGKLDQLEQDLRARPKHPLVGTPSLHASIISGGTEISVYPASCTLEVERRTNPGERAPQATAELQQLIDSLSTEFSTMDLTLEEGLERLPFEVSAEAEIVRTVESAMTNVLGSIGEHVGASFWTDAAFAADADIETVLLGPIGAGLHSKEEWVDVESCINLAAILAQSAITYCRVA